MINKIDNFLINGIEISPTIGLLIIICYICYLICLWKKTQSPIFFLLFFIMWGCGFMGGGLAGMSKRFLFGLIFCICAILAPILFMGASSNLKFHNKYNNEINENNNTSNNKEDDWINVKD